MILRFIIYKIVKLGKY